MDDTKFTIAFRLTVEIVWPETGTLGAVKIQAPHFDEPRTLYNFEKLIPEDSKDDTYVVWRFDDKLYWRREGLVKAIENFVQQDWRLSR